MYIYLLQEREFVNSNEPVYKIGRTGQQNYIDRLRNYPKSSNLYLVLPVKDPVSIENQVLEMFRSKYISRTDIGSEYFEGLVDDMVQDITDIVGKQPDDGDNDLVMYICRTCFRGFPQRQSLVQHKKNSKACMKNTKGLEELCCKACDTIVYGKQDLRYHKTYCVKYQVQEHTKELRKKIEKLEQRSNNKQAQIVKRQQYHSEPKPIVFIREEKQKLADGTVHKIRCDKLYQLYVSWCKEKGYNNVCDIRIFGKTISKHVYRTRIVIDNRQVWHYFIKSDGQV